MIGNRQAMVENRIKAVLADKRKTYKWLAFELSMSENTILRWSSNKLQLSLQHLYPVVNVLHLRLNCMVFLICEKKFQAFIAFCNKNAIEYNITKNEFVHYIYLCTIFLKVSF